jgi:hypothetical protein
MKSNTKTQAVKSWLETHPHMTAKEIAECVGCHTTYVYQVKKGSTMKVTKARAGKAVKIGRPTKASIEANALTQACDVLINLVKGIKDFCIAFDHNKPEVEIVWGEEIYNTPTHDMARVIESIKYMESLKQTFSN